ncbi:hypothetical protein ILUMI_15567, partial [Ignelater luminosus]
TLEDVVNEDEQFQLIKLYHVGKTNHKCIQEMLKSISRRYYFPKMYDQINRYVNQCEICQKATYERSPITIVPELTETSSKPFEIVHLDLFFIDNEIITLVDQFSRYLNMYPVKSQNQTEIIFQLTKFIAQFPLPTKFVADNQFDT